MKLEGDYAYIHIAWITTFCEDIIIASGGRFPYKYSKLLIDWAGSFSIDIIYPFRSCIKVE